MAVRINRESPPPTPKCAGENYFRFGAAILEIDRGPQAGHGTVNPVEIDQQTMKIWRDGKSGEVGPVVFDHLQTWRVIASGGVFERLPVCLRWVFDELVLLEVRLNDLCGIPAWRQ